MSKIPEIKVGLQIKDVDGHLSTVYKIEGERVFFGWPSCPESTAYNASAVRRYLARGEWQAAGPKETKLSTLFSSLPHNVLQTALEECAEEDGRGRQEESTAAFLHWNTPDYVVQSLADKIYELGYQITPKP